MSCTIIFRSICVNRITRSLLIFRDDALSLINGLENKKQYVMRLCARFSGSNQEINDMHEKVCEYNLIGTIIHSFFKRNCKIGSTKMNLSSFIRSAFFHESSILSSLNLLISFFFKNSSNFYAYCKILPPARFSLTFI